MTDLQKNLEWIQDVKKVLINVTVASCCAVDRGAIEYRHMHRENVQITQNSLHHHILL